MLQVVVSRGKDPVPHVNIQVDTRPVAGEMVVLNQERPDGSLLLATGNKVRIEHAHTFISKKH